MRRTIKVLLFLNVSLLLINIYSYIIINNPTSGSEYGLLISIKNQNGENKIISVNLGDKKDEVLKLLTNTGIVFYEHNATSVQENYAIEFEEFRLLFKNRRLVFVVYSDYNGDATVLPKNYDETH